MGKQMDTTQSARISAMDRASPMHTDLRQRGSANRLQREVAAPPQPRLVNPGDHQNEELMGSLDFHSYVDLNLCNQWMRNLDVRKTSTLLCAEDIIFYIMSTSSAESGERWPDIPSEDDKKYSDGKFRLASDMVSVAKKCLSIRMDTIAVKAQKQPHISSPPRQSLIPPRSTRLPSQTRNIPQNG